MIISGGDPSTEQESWTCAVVLEDFVADMRACDAWISLKTTVKTVFQTAI
jgi:hypothetical protein